ncbi:MAG: 3-ketoacyl-ACP reductase [Verrucomicrobia bacterium]|nr:3-ketoacyl-ACP reductase [Verrucomicrobiota bacterium]
MNRVALITGSSRGIGRGIAIALAGTGMDLVINFASNVEAARETADRCIAAGAAGGKTVRAEICLGDISSADDRAALLDFVRATYGRLDLLVNNAGITSIGRADVLDATEENFDRLMAVNLKGPYFLTQQASRWMIEQVQSAGADTEGAPASPEIVSRPKIITISSVSAYTVSVNRGDYCMAKAALGMMTKVYATRLAEYGIHVYEICPGVIASDMTSSVKEKYDQLIAEGLTPIARWGTPEDVGRAVVAIAGDLLPFSTGEVINVDGGFHLRRL